MLRALGFVWTLPNTVLGLLLGALTLQLPRFEDGMVIFDGSPRGLTWLLPRMHRGAMTVGVVVLSAEPVRGTLLAHEAHHVHQYMAWGPLFLPAYIALAIPFGYRRHPFERTARRVAGEPEVPPRAPAGAGPSEFR